MSRHTYPPEGNPERAREIRNLVASVAGTPVPRYVREPERFADRLHPQEVKR